VGPAVSEFRLDFNRAPKQPSEHAEEPDLPSRDEILAALQASAYLWVPELFPAGKKESNGKGRVWRVADISGRAPGEQGSCCIYLDGDDAGGYHEFGPAAKDGGDAISTIADHFRLREKEVYPKAREIAERYGGRINGHASLPRRSIASDHKPNAAFELSRSGPATGTLAATYFASRGLTLPACDDLRFSADCTHWDENKIATAKPALLAVIRYPDGRPTGGIHRTYLMDDGSGRLDRKMLGPADGGVVMLDMPLPGGTLSVAEGIESAAAAMQLSGIPCWSTLSAGGMRKFGAWLVASPNVIAISRLVVFADCGNDGETAAAELRDVAIAVGLAVEVYLPRGGDDFADDLVKGLAIGEPGELGEPEILLPAPPVTIDDLEAEAKNLSPTSDIKTICSVIRKLAAAQVSPLEEDRILETIRLHTRGRIAPLRDALKDAKRELGFVTKTVGGSSAPSWASKAITNDYGEPKPIVANVELALREDDGWRGALAFNEFTEWITLRSAPPLEDRAAFVERPWTDADTRQTTLWVQRAGIHAPSGIVFEAVAAVAEQRHFHPVRDYLDSLQWDGKPRLTRWLTYYLGVEPEPLDKTPSEDDRTRCAAQISYIEAIGPRWMISAVRRIYSPGEKVDCALVLIGPQGLLKSTVFNVLGGRWFTDQIPDLRSKDAALQLAGIWIVEFAELAAIKASENEYIKKWMSIRTDRYRAPYDKRPTDHPRQSVFGATTNDEQFLHDVTGARRWWSVKCGERIDIEALQRDRDQLWAEAVHRYRLGEKHWLDTKELETVAAAEAEKHRVPHPWEDLIRKYLAGDPVNGRRPPQQVFTDEILIEVLYKPRGDWKRTDEMTVSDCLRALGWVKGKQIWTAENRGKRPFLLNPKELA
jgi:putative DNA primase/helicase